MKSSNVAAESAVVEESPKQALLARLKAAEQLLEVQQERAEVAELEERVRVAEQAVIDAPAIARAEAELGPRGKKFDVVETDLGAIILKRPNPLLFRQYQDKGKNDTEALEKLVRPTVFYPTKAQFDSICDELPYTLTRCADRVSVLAGVRIADLRPKS